MLRTTWFQSFRMVVKPAYSNFVHYIVELILIVSCFLNILSVAAHCTAVLQLAAVQQSNFISVVIMTAARSALFLYNHILVSTT